MYDISQKETKSEETTSEYNNEEETKSEETTNEDNNKKEEQTSEGKHKLNPFLVLVWQKLLIYIYQVLLRNHKKNSQALNGILWQEN